MQRAIAALTSLLLLVTAAPASAGMPEQVTAQRPSVEVAFVLDTTGSMGGLLEGAKEKIWSIASRISHGQPAPRLKVGLVAYRDRGDAYVVKKLELTGDLDTVFRELRTFRADGGGDHPEHVGRGLGEAVSGLRWSDDRKTMKMIFVVGDAPPQQYQDGWDYRTWARRALQQNIVVNAIRCGDDGQTELAFREISRLGEGTFASIGQAGGMISVVTPFDAEVSRLNARIARATIFGGKQEARRKSAENARELGGMAGAVAADRASYMAAAKMPAAPAPAPGGVDLIAAPQELERMEENDLPEELKVLNAPARKEKLESLSKERKALEAELRDISSQRDAYLKSHSAEKKDSFDATVMKEVATRAVKFGIKY